MKSRFPGPLSSSAACRPKQPPIKPLARNIQYQDGPSPDRRGCAPNFEQSQRRHLKLESRTCTPSPLDGRKFKNCGRLSSVHPLLHAWKRQPASVTGEGIPQVQRLALQVELNMEHNLWQSMHYACVAGSNQEACRDEFFNHGLATSSPAEVSISPWRCSHIRRVFRIASKAYF